MEFAENFVAFLIPGFLLATFFDSIFWMGISIMLAAGFLAAYPINYIMLKRGKTHVHHWRSLW
jgi:glycopeptide antibiotics resistance protein